MHFDLKYDGPAVAEGRMNAAVLGQAILGVSRMLDGAAEAIHGDKAKLRVEIQGDFKGGSMRIDFVALAGVEGMLQQMSLQDLAALAEILGLGGSLAAGAVGTVIGIIRWQRGRKIDRVERKQDGVHITIEGDVIVTTPTVYNAFSSQKVREGLEGVVEPLTQPGIEILDIGANKGPREVITSGEAKLFDASLAPGQELGKEEVFAFVEVIAPSFKEGNKWRFAQGSAVFFADVLDEGFLETVKRGDIRFGQGDILRVRMLVESSRQFKKLVFDRTILEVIQHYPANQDEQGDLLAG